MGGTGRRGFAVTPCPPVVSRVGEIGQAENRSSFWKKDDVPRRFAQFCAVKLGGRLEKKSGIALFPLTSARGKRGIAVIPSASLAEH